MTGVIYNLPERNFDSWPEKQLGPLVTELVGKPGALSSAHGSWALLIHI